MDRHSDLRLWEQKTMLNLLIKFLILCGIALMVVNIVRFYRFNRQQNDVLSDADDGRGNLHAMEWFAFSLLVFFLFGYLFTFFNDADVVIALVLFGGSVFVSIIETALFTQVQTVKDRTTQISEVLVNVIESRDPNLIGHSMHVRNLSQLLYKYMPSDLQDKISPVSLSYAALMHDLGQAAVPDEILNKPGPLNEEEWKIVKIHPKKAVEMLSPIHAFDPIASWIRDHHERPDGRGYYHVPDDEIPLGAKIISVCDTYSVITMRRNYKAQGTYEQAIEIMKSVAGTQLDKRLVDCFVRIPKEEVLQCIPNTGGISPWER